MTAVWHWQSVLGGLGLAASKELITPELLLLHCSLGHRGAACHVTSQGTGSSPGKPHNGALCHSM